MTTARLFIAFLLVIVGLGWALTIWWLANGFWRLIRWMQRSSSQ